ncbi:uncharacterized protein LOC143239243 [Tachypleus tridentatus]|uniref:uncharacterized protein LOC143239243 n=1 Tax=Tachypleus tridentatus TaxID=6853 RepID=UPI003FD59EE4
MSCFKFVALLPVLGCLMTSQAEQYVNPASGYENHRPSAPKLSVLIYDKRALFDPPGHYGKGPWEIFTHGYGLKYGFNNDKFTEKGYGYVKALGRNFCRDNPHSCPNYYNHRPFVFRGIREPYWGYRPRGGILHPLKEAVALARGYHLI